MRALVICAVLVGGLWQADMIGRDALAHEGATGIIKERMDNFSAARNYMKAMRGAVGANDFAKIDEITNKMMPWAETMSSYFPEGSDKSPSEAAPTIWSDRAGFEMKITAYHEAIQALNARHYHKIAPLQHLLFGRLVPAVKAVTKAIVNS